MIFFYVDESGTGLKDLQSAFFVLGCITVDEREWQRIDGEVTLLKRRLISWAKPEDWEIKARDMRRGDRLFRNQNWEIRAKAFHAISSTISEFQCRLIVVQVDKRLLPRSVQTDTDLYRLAFWRLLDELDKFLHQNDKTGMMLFDMRSSSLHSSIQDRRLIDAYRDWLSTKTSRNRFVGMPWFGFSEFYAGLQLADFVSYLVDFTHNEIERGKRSRELYEAFQLIESKLHLIKIP